MSAEPMPYSPAARNPFARLDKMTPEEVAAEVADLSSFAGTQTVYGRLHAALSEVRRLQEILRQKDESLRINEETVKNASWLIEERRKVPS